MILAFLRSPLGRVVLAGLAGLLVVGAVCTKLYSSGRKAGDAEAVARSAPIIARLTADLGQCAANLDGSTKTLKTQTAAVLELKRQGDARLAEVKRLTAWSRKATLKAEQASAYIRAHPPAGPDVCTRMLNGYEIFKGALR